MKAACRTGGIGPDEPPWPGPGLRVPWGLRFEEAGRQPVATPLDLPQQFLNFFPLPHGQGSLRPTLWPMLRIGSTGPVSPRWSGGPPACCESPGDGSVADDASAWIAAVSCQVLLRASSSTCSMR